MAKIMLDTPAGAPIEEAAALPAADEASAAVKDKSDDSAVLFIMKQGTIAWQSGVAERFAQKLINTINARMNAATDKFQKDLTHGHGHEGTIVQAILALRKEMAFLSDAINLPAIPEKDRAQYLALVREQASKMQESLEESAR